MKTALVPEPRTAAALAARRRKTETALQRVRSTIARLRREKAQVSVAAVARRAGVSRTFLYDNSEARAAVSTAMAEASESRPPVARRPGRRTRSNLARTRTQRRGCPQDDPVRHPHTAHPHW